MSQKLPRKRIGFHGIVNRITTMSYGQLAVLYGGTILLFGIVYFVLATFLPGHGPSIPGGAHPLLRFLESLYFSTITATTVGYGDIAPHGFSKILVGFQAISSLFIFAVLVSKPISERQEAALYQMHQMTFDEIFNATREGFFIVRKDLDQLTEEAQTSGSLKPVSIENLTTAYRQAQVFLEEIPKFYDTERKLYIIDERREGLLLESVERTFDRLLSLLKILDTDHISWREHRTNVDQLEELLSLAQETVKFWHRNSPHSNGETFGKLDGLIRAIGARVNG